MPSSNFGAKTTPFKFVTDPGFHRACREMEAHVKKMHSIGKNYITAKEARTVTAQLKRNREERKKTKDFLTNEKNLTINKDNQILLNKLVEISSGKWSSVAPAPKRRINRSQ